MSWCYPQVPHFGGQAGACKQDQNKNPINIKGSEELDVIKSERSYRKSLTFLKITFLKKK